MITIIFDSLDIARHWETLFLIFPRIFLVVGVVIVKVEGHQTLTVGVIHVPD